MKKKKESKKNFPTKEQSRSSITTYTCFSTHNLLYFDDGRLVSWGENDYGQCGNKTFENIPKPQLLTTLPNVKEICLGFKHTLILLFNGKLFGFGDNSKGQLGIGEKTECCNKPKLILQDEKIKEIKAGLNFSVLWKENGEIWVFGENEKGQLGITTLKNQFKPVLAIKDENIIQISCSKNRIVYLKNNGEIWLLGHVFYSCNCTVKEGESLLLTTDTEVDTIFCDSILLFVYKKSGIGYFIPFHCRDKDWPESFAGLKMMSCGEDTMFMYFKNGDIKYYCYPIHWNWKFIPFSKDTEIDKIVFGKNLALFYKKNGEVHLLQCQFGRETKTAKLLPIWSMKDAVYLLKDESLSIMNCGKRYLWSTESHRFSSISFKKGLFVFLLCLNRIQKTNAFKLSKFLLRDIIREIGYFGSSKSKNK